MSKKAILIFFVIGITLFFILCLWFFIAKSIYPYKIYFFLLFLSSCCMLPKSLNDVNSNEKSSPIDWKLLTGNIIGIIFSLISFIVCLVRNV